jgi:transcriptional regulator with XRE-family HTH domain
MPRPNRNLSEESTEYERDVAEAIGARVRARRKELQLTPEEVHTRMAALRVEVARTQFSRIELGDSLLSAAEVIALAGVAPAPPGGATTTQRLCYSGCAVSSSSVKPSCSV